MYMQDCPDNDLEMIYSYSGPISHRQCYNYNWEVEVSLSKSYAAPFPLGRKTRGGGRGRSKIPESLDSRAASGRGELITGRGRGLEGKPGPPLLAGNRPAVRRGL